MSTLPSLLSYLYFLILLCLTNGLDLKPSTADSSVETIYRDVLVIGGGSTGTYTAVRLRDHNHSVAVVEPKSHLGGHAETYVAPNGYTIDIGVIVFTQIPTVKNYFARFNVPLELFNSSGPQPDYIDFKTGYTDTAYVSQTPEAIGDALEAFGAQLAKYPSLSESFNLTYPVADDLLLPFGEFVQKNNLSGFMHTLFITNQGYSPLLNISTLYMFKYLNAGELSSFANGFLTTQHHNVQELYQKAGAFLGADNIFLNSSVVSMDRSKSQPHVTINTSTGMKLIIAKKLVVTAPPLLSNLEASNFDLSKKEKHLFGRFFANGYYTGIMNNTGLPLNFSSEAVQPGQPYGTPLLPGLYSMRQNLEVPGLVQVYYGSPTVLSNDIVKADIETSLNRVKRARGLPTAEAPSWVTFSSHAPFNLMVSNAAIQDRFYKRLFALQGRRNTFWNGAAWDAQDSSALWQFTEDYLLPKILATL